MPIAEKYISISSAIDFISKDTPRIIGSVNNIKDNFYTEKIPICLEMTFEGFKKSYVNFEKHLKYIKENLEMEHGGSFVLTNLIFNNPDPYCGIRGNTMIVEACFNKINICL